MRFYTANGPRWWPFVLVSLANRSVPRVDRCESVIIDNGMWGFYKRGFRPDFDVWIAKLKLFARDVERILRPAEVIVVSPDWVGDVEFTLRAAARARGELRDYRVMCVCHFNARISPRDAAEGLAPYADVLGAPLKLTCTRPGKTRRIPLPHRQRAVASAVASAARRHGLRVHGLGLMLSPEHILRLVGVIDSFDTTAWTRPNTTTLRKHVPRSFRCSDEKSLFFAAALARLVGAGVPIEGAEVLARIQAPPSPCETGG